MSQTRSSGPARPLVRLAVLTVLLVLAWLPAAPALAQDAEVFGGLEAGRGVYDGTGTSLTGAQFADLEARIGGVRAAGADVVVWVRALDASSDETFDQVEALQQAWVRQTGANQDTAAAILVNRSPADPGDARAGIFVGRTFAEGNVPEDEQRAIVEDALIPPLREGDVHAALAAALDRLGSSIRTGPPVSAFDRFAAGVANGSLPWGAIGTALAALAGALGLYARRSRTDRPAQEPTTTRPGELPPAVAGALVAGTPTVQVLPAVLLDLAGRGAVAIEAEDGEGGWASSPRVRVRLVDRGRLRDDVERAVWDQLVERADGDVVGSGALATLTGQPGPAREALRSLLRERGWLDDGARGVQIGLTVIAVGSALAGFAGLILTGVGGGPLLAWLAVGALLAVAVVAFVLLASYSSLTREGQETAIPWRAYRDGLKRAGKDERVALDLDTALPDAVAMGVGDALGDRMQAATERGVPLRAFSATTSGGAPLATFPWWVAFTSTTTGSSSGGTTVSGGGAGGGSGAAGST